MRKLLLVLAVLAALVATPAALAWHADGVTVTAECSEGTYSITASIQQSDEFPGAFVVSVNPSSLPGVTLGTVSVTVVIGWPDSTDTQTFTKSVNVDGKCTPPNEPPPPTEPPREGPKDWCPNIPHTQQDQVPEGMVLDANGNCVTVAETPPAPRDPTPPPPPPATEPPPPPPAEEPPPPAEEPPATPEPPPAEEPTPTPEPEQPKPEPPVKPNPPEELPFTGSNDVLPMLLGLLLVGSGLLLRKAPALSK
jgi:LPXTG-motif cell wall-anchored protein